MRGLSTKKRKELRQKRIQITFQINEICSLRSKSKHSPEALAEYDKTLLNLGLQLKEIKLSEVIHKLETKGLTKELYLQCKKLDMPDIDIIKILHWGSARLTNFKKEHGLLTKKEVLQ